MRVTRQVSKKTSLTNTELIVERSQSWAAIKDAEPQAEKEQHLEDRISFNRNQKPEGVCTSQEGGICQVSREQSH